MDNGSSVNIMFKPTLEKIGLADRDLKPYSTLLYGFGGDGTSCAGMIELAVTLGEYPLSVTKMIDFVVVEIKSAYNLIIGRPLLASLGAISSIRHLTLKFPTPRGVGIVRGDKLAARECYNISIRGRGQPGAQTLVVTAEVEEAPTVEVSDVDPRIGEEQIDMEPVEELEEVPLTSEDATRTVRIGKSLTAETK